MPKLYSVMKALMMVDDTNQLQKIYDKISAAIQDRNGLVVDYNPLLTALLGCNTNLLFLGAKEQSRGALFYIGPYINKNGVEIIDALPLMVSAQEEVLLFPSVAEDSDPTKRTVQHVLTRTLNKLNSQMEISDTQAAGALMCLSARMTSESFSYLDFNGYKNFILDSIDLLLPLLTEYHLEPDHRDGFQLQVFALRDNRSNCLEVEILEQLGLNLLEACLIFCPVLTIA